MKYGIEGDVARIEVKLKQELLDGQVLRRAFDDTIEKCGHFHVGAVKHCVLLPAENHPGAAITVFNGR